MPIFEYRCNQCDHQFEKLVSKADSLVTCDKCDSNEITKLFSSFSSRVNSGSTSCSTGGCAPTVGSCRADSGFS